MIVTISGLPGSGKTSAGKKLAELLNYKFYSVGDLRGQIAQEKGMTIDELNALDEEWTHKEVDARTKKIGETDNVVIDGWMAWHFIPNSFKVFLKVNMDVAAKRIFEHQRPDEPHEESVEDEKKLIIERLKTSAAQFKEFYGVDFLDKSNYDLVVDTSELNVNMIVEKIKSAFQNT